MASLPQLGVDRPFVAVLADARGTEAPDLLMPYSILSKSGAVDVRVVAWNSEPIRLTLGIAWVAPQLTLDQLEGFRRPDVVVIPAMQVVRNPGRLQWLRKQAEHGARIMSICEGAKVLAAAGLLDGRQATTHWYSRAKLARSHPHVHWREDLRWVTDGPITTTTGISAAIPASLALLSELAGEEVMQRTADRLALPPPDQRHQGANFRLTRRGAATVLRNRLAFWQHENVAVPLVEGLDEMGFASVLDAWSRTYRSIAWAAGAALSVTSSEGLTFIRARTLPRTFRQRAAIPQSDVMHIAFEQVKCAYGRATAQFVALQFEHPYEAVA
jgi:putative intracellular protease/amidase